MHVFNKKRFSNDLFRIIHEHQDKTGVLKVTDEFRGELERTIQSSHYPDQVEAKDLKQVTDTGAIEALVDEVITNNPEQVEQYLAADDKKRKKLVGFFVGQIMKASKGQANPQQVNQVLAQKLK